MQCLTGSQIFHDRQTRLLHQLKSKGHAFLEEQSYGGSRTPFGSILTRNEQGLKRRNRSFLISVEIARKGQLTNWTVLLQIVKYIVVEICDKKFEWRGVPSRQYNAPQETSKRTTIRKTHIRSCNKMIFKINDLKKLIINKIRFQHFVNFQNEHTLHQIIEFFMNAQGLTQQLQRTIFLQQNTNFFRRKNFANIKNFASIYTQYQKVINQTKKNIPLEQGEVH
eukprot:TRINITY_DN307_c1_g1_i17.p2 TRINITY_DN307_c1_g1~~TRINITY_DN307_c1_g1_i17.p2  ORF type:complete len:223 (+),score=-5.92 TRINITY_DN307_c1_g1_i17:1071-1739(+)